MAHLEPLFIGIGGHVAAIDRATGTELWRRKLRSAASFTTIHYDGTYLFAATSGHLYCLDPATGEPLWHNNLPGLGYSVVSFGDDSGPSIAAAARAKRAAAAGAAS